MPYTQQGIPFQSHSDTSRDAAIRAEKFVGPQGEKVWGYLVWCGSRGATQKEIALGLCLSRASVAARVNALEKSGQIQKSTARREGCAVYQSTEAR